MGTYSETFLYFLHYFLQIIFEVTYVGLVHYDFVTLRRKYSHLVLEHARNQHRIKTSLLLGYFRTIELMVIAFVVFVVPKFTCAYDSKRVFRCLKSTIGAPYTVASCLM